MFPENVLVWLKMQVIKQCWSFVLLVFLLYPMTNTSSPPQGLMERLCFVSVDCHFAWTILEAPKRSLFLVEPVWIYMPNVLWKWLKMATVLCTLTWEKVSLNTGGTYFGVNVHKIGLKTYLSRYKRGKYSPRTSCTGRNLMVKERQPARCFCLGGQK